MRYGLVLLISRGSISGLLVEVLYTSRINTGLLCSVTAVGNTQPNKQTNKQTIGLSSACSVARAAEPWGAICLPSLYELMLCVCGGSTGLVMSGDTGYYFRELLYVCMLGLPGAPVIRIPGHWCSLLFPFYYERSFVCVCRYE